MNVLFHLAEALGGFLRAQSFVYVEVNACQSRRILLQRLQTEPRPATGDPSRASAFKGERLLAVRIDDMLLAFMKRWPDLCAVAVYVV